jgi:hypothetical protein
MTAPDSRFADRAILGRPRFLVLSFAGVAIALLLAGYYTWRKLQDPGYPLGVRIALVTLVLLNARQNLRQYKLATLLMATRGASGGRLEAPPPGR